jgi:hypothetical protein
MVDHHELKRRLTRFQLKSELLRASVARRPVERNVERVSVRDAPSQRRGTIPASELWLEYNE